MKAVPSPYREFEDSTDPAPLAELAWQRRVLRSAGWAAALLAGEMLLLLLTAFLPWHLALIGLVAWCVLGAGAAIATWKLTAPRPRSAVGPLGWLLRVVVPAYPGSLGLVVLGVRLGLASYLAALLPVAPAIAHQALIVAAAFDLDQLLAVARFRHLAAWQVVKAVGRIEPLKGPRPPAQLALLVRVLHDSRLDPEARFAAASALTRFTSEDALRAISSERYFLDFSAGMPLAARFIDTIRRRREHERLMARIDRAHWDYQMAPLWHRALRAYAETHPLALDDLASPPYFSQAHNAELRARCAKSLLEMARHFDRYSEPWDTYASAPYELLWIVEGEFAPQDFTAEQLTAVGSAVKAYLAAHPRAR